MIPERINATWWRRWLVDLAFGWNLLGRLRLSRFAWKASRFLATESTHMALAAYCAGIMMNKHLAGDYDCDSLSAADPKELR